MTGMHSCNMRCINPQSQAANSSVLQVQGAPGRLPCSSSSRCSLHEDISTPSCACYVALLSTLATAEQAQWTSWILPAAPGIRR